MPAYRVYVEQWRSGWIDVTAKDEEHARDQAQDTANDRWYPARQHAHTSTVELLRPDAEAK